MGEFLRCLWLYVRIVGGETWAERTHRLGPIPAWEVLLIEALDDARRQA